MRKWPAGKIWKRSLPCRATNFKSSERRTSLAWHCKWGSMAGAGLCMTWDPSCRQRPQDHRKALKFYPKCDRSCYGGELLKTEIAWLKIMLAICVGGRWKRVDKLAFAITHMGRWVKHNLCSDSSYNVIGVIILYIKTDIKRAIRAQMQVSLILLLKCWDFIRKGLWTATCETKAGIGKLLWRIKSILGSERDILAFCCN